MNARLLKLVPWGLVLLVVAGLAWEGNALRGAREQAVREQGRVVELQRLRELAEQDASDARRIAMALGDTAEMVRQEGAEARQAAELRAARARQDARTAEGRLRTTLDSLGASTGALGGLLVAHSVEIAAKDTVIQAQGRELVAVRSYAESMAVALAKADARSVALEAERDSYRRQAEAWQRAASPPLLLRLGKELGRAALWGGAGYLSGKL
jgi:hypothetical protein